MEIGDIKENLIIGTKQTLKTAKAGNLSVVFIAKDVESSLFARLYSEMLKANVEIIFVPTKKELGEKCGIDVSCAVAGVLKEK